MKFSRYSIVIGLLCLLHSVHANVYDSLKQVKEGLLEHYNKDAVPVPNKETSLVVNVNLYVMALQNLDEQSQVLSTSAFFMIEWDDFMFTWNESTVNNVDRMTVRVKDLWVPDVFVVNSVNDMRVSHFEENEYVNVLSSGHMTWYPSCELMTSCSVDISRYPFDVQICSIRIESWYHDGRDFTFKPGNPGIDYSSSHFTENGEWLITNMTSYSYRYSHYVDNNIFYTGVEYKITLARRSQYHFLTTVFPFLILMFLNSISTLIPTECGEKLGFCMSQFLTMIVYLTLVAQCMPVSSLTISHFAMVVGSQILISGISTFVVALSISFQNKPENSRPPKLFQMVLTPIAYYKNVSSDKNGTSHITKISWKLLDKRINDALKVMLYTNVLVCFCFVTFFQWMI